MEEVKTKFLQLHEELELLKSQYEAEINQKFEALEKTKFCEDIIEYNESAKMSTGVRILSNYPQVETDLAFFEAEKKDGLASIGLSYK